MIGWNSATAGAYNFTAMPGGGAVAGSYSLNGTTTTWVPLLDTSGSTIGLVNAAQPDAGPSTTYTYSPSGNPTASGTANHWPFQYHGMEKEFTDPAPYYYSGNGQFYSPQMVRSLAEAGQTSSSGTGGPSPIQLPYGPGSQGNGSFGQWYLGQLNPHFGQFDPAALSDINISVGTSEGGSTVIPVGAIAEAIYELVSFFEWLLGGSSAPPTPRQLLHGRHPLYPLILGIQEGLIPTEGSSAFPQPSQGLVLPSLQSTPNLSRDSEESPASTAFPAGYLVPVVDIRPLANTSSPSPSPTPTPLPPCEDVDPGINDEINRNLLKGIGPLPDEELGCHPFITVPTPKPGGRTIAGAAA